MLRIFRFYLGNDSVVIFKDDGSMENSHNSVDVVRGTDISKVVLIDRQYLKAKKPLYEKYSHSHQPALTHVL